MLQHVDRITQLGVANQRRYQKRNLAFTPSTPADLSHTLVALYPAWTARSVQICDFTLLFLHLLMSRAGVWVESLKSGEFSGGTRLREYNRLYHISRQLSNTYVLASIAQGIHVVSIACFATARQRCASVLLKLGLPQPSGGELDAVA